MSKQVYRYPGIRPFQESDRDVFFGREEDIKRLTRLIKLEKLIILFGKSGYGKTSLINAGVSPLLKAEGYQVQTVRFGAFNKKHNEFGIHIPTASPLKKMIEKIDEHKEEHPFLTRLTQPEHLPLWYYFKNGQLKRPAHAGTVIFIDQFEELFTYPKDQIVELCKQLAQVVFGFIPKAYEKQFEELMEKNDDIIFSDEFNTIYEKIDLKIIFAIRSDKLSLVDRIKDFLPGIFNNTYELKALQSDTAVQAIVRPAQEKGDQYISPVFFFEDAALNKIISFLSKSQMQSTPNHDIQIESFQLQLICQFIEQKIIKRTTLLGKERYANVTEKDLGDLDVILSQFYEEQMNQIGDSRARNVIQTFIENELIEDGIRIGVYKGKLLKTLSKEGLDEQLLDKLIATRIVRIDISTTGAETLEISHDSLVEPILEAKERREGVSESKKKEFDVINKQKDIQIKKQLEFADINEVLSPLDNNVFRRTLNVLFSKLFYSKNQSRTYAANYFKRANLYLDIFAYERAIKDLNESLKYYLTPETINNRGFAHYQLGNADEALSDFREAVKLNPLEPGFLNNLSVLYMEIGDYDKAINNFHSIRDKNTDISVLNNQGVIYYNRNRQNGFYTSQSKEEEAFEHFERALKKEPTHPYLLNNKGVLHFNLSQYQKAIEYFELAVNADNYYIDALYNRAITWMQLKKYAEARKDLDALLDINPKHVEAYRARSECHKRLNQFQLANRDYKKVLELAPERITN